MLFYAFFYSFMIIMPFFQSVSLHAMLPLFRRFLPRFKVQSASLWKDGKQEQSTDDSESSANWEQASFNTCDNLFIVRSATPDAGPSVRVYLQAPCLRPNHDKTMQRDARRELKQEKINKNRKGQLKQHREWQRRKIRKQRDRINLITVLSKVWSCSRSCMRSSATRRQLPKLFFNSWQYLSTKPCLKDSHSLWNSMKRYLSKTFDLHKASQTLNIQIKFTSRWNSNEALSRIDGIHHHMPPIATSKGALNGLFTSTPRVRQNLRHVRHHLATIEAVKRRWLQTRWAAK